MIVSSLHKFIFVAIPKTGTHAIRRALRQHMGPQDLEQVGLFVQRSLPVPELAALGHGHITLQQVRPFMRPEDFDAFFKFAFVRNPFDRFVSYCAFMTRTEGQFEKDPQAVMKRFVEVPPHHHILFQPQHSFISGADGKLLADFLRAGRANAGIVRRNLRTDRDPDDRAGEGQQLEAERLPPIL